jgi:hypothetical protein
VHGSHWGRVPQEEGLKKGAHGLASETDEESIFLSTNAPSGVSYILCKTLL